MDVGFASRGDPVVFIPHNMGLFMLPACFYDGLEGYEGRAHSPCVEQQSRTGGFEMEELMLQLRDQVDRLLPVKAARV